MTQGYYTFRIQLANRNNVQAEAHDPGNKRLGQPSGVFGYKGQAQARILDLDRAARTGQLAEAGVEELGEKLFAALLDEKLRRDFFNLCKKADQDKALLRIELDVDERELPDVAALPWEFMRTPSDQDYGNVWLGTAPSLIFSRRRARWTEPEPIQLQPGERLRIALAISAPSDLGTVKYDKVEEALKGLANGQDQIDLLGIVNPATPVAIDAILEREPHIFHFIGHARLKDEKQNDTGEIALVDDTLGKAQWMAAKHFSELFTRHQPGIVVLQACEGAALSASQAFVGVASQVVQQDISVVVAMQYEVSNSTAQRFAIEFYRRLSLGDPVDKAAQEGRRRIALGPVRYSARDFATPVLFMRVPDGHLFQRPTDAEPIAAQPTPSALVDPELAELRVQYETAYTELEGMHPRHPDFAQTQNKVNNLKQSIRQKKHQLGLPEFPQAAPERIDRIKLRDILYKHFDINGLKNLCTDLNIPYEDLPQDRSGLAREIVGYCKRYVRTYALIEAAYRERPQAAWEEI